MGRTPSIAPAAPDPYAVALLSGGDRAAVTVAVLGLHLRGAVEAGRPGTLRRTRTGRAEPVRHPLEKAVRTGLYRPAGPRELPGRAVVRRALARMRAELAADGLLRELPPRRTRATRRLLAELRERRPLPESPDGLPEEEALLAVALYGERALTVLVPHFAREAGLTGRGALADEGRFPFGRGNSLRHLISGGDPYDSADHGLGGWGGDDRGGGAHGGYDHGGHGHGGHDFGGGGGGGFD
ncbi:TIGR04222 domain-containing membrane protein [Streptomyces sp. NPDC052727]|uniref:TIGR04222 domain-containing membrane protein n=1 Tax=unclassified Streptomyces TaxID=2593676 RepID=UPI003444514B